MGGMGLHEMGVGGESVVTEEADGQVAPVIVEKKMTKSESKKNKEALNNKVDVKWTGVFGIPMSFQNFQENGHVEDEYEEGGNHTMVKRDAPSSRACNIL